ncbi:MAG: hemolysin III family protein [Simkaniaceae bacterium]
MLQKIEKECTSQTHKEEIANVVTHGIGFILSLFGCVYLIYDVIKNGGVLHVASSVFYGVSLVAVYTTSTLYHLCRNQAKKLLQRLDHISIYLLISGTYMPIVLLVLKGKAGWILFGIESSMCVIGVTFKAIYGHKYEALSCIFYLLMGWLIIFVIKPLVASLPFHALVWLFTGGVFYTGGVIFFALDKKYHYFHAIWHLFVLAGSFAHFYLISSYIFTFPTGV